MRRAIIPETTGGQFHLHTTRGCFVTSSTDTQSVELSKNKSMRQCILKKRGFQIRWFTNKQEFFPNMNDIIVLNRKVDMVGIILLARDIKIGGTIKRFITGAIS